MQLFFFLFPYGRAVAKIVCVSPPSLFSFGIMGGGECDTVVQYAACPLNFVVTSSRGVIDGGKRGTIRFRLLWWGPRFRFFSLRR